VKPLRRTHIAASAAYVALALTVGGMIVVPMGALPGFDGHRPALQSAARETDGSTPQSSPLPPVHRESHGAARDGRGDASPTDPAPSTSSPSSPAASAVAEEHLVAATEVKESPALFGFNEMASVGSYNTARVEPDTGQPTDAAAGSSTPSPAGPGAATKGTRDSQEPKPGAPAPTDPAPVTPAPQPPAPAVAATEKPSPRPDEPTGGPEGTPEPSPSPTPTSPQPPAGEQNDGATPKPAPPASPSATQGTEVSGTTGTATPAPTPG